jgi:uncharacterized protein (TIGR00725 family)
MRKLIAVIGSSQASKEVLDTAFEVGREIITAGYSMICGGLKGVMEAACRGAFSEAGGGSGRIIGVLPGTEKDEANPYVDIVIPTGIGYARNMIIACSADAVIAVSGGCGTLSELSMAWQYGKPIAVMEGLPGITGFLIGKSLASGPLDERRKDKIIGAKSASKAVSLITKILEKAE